MKLSKLVDCRNWPIFLLRVGLLVCVMVVNSTASMALRTADFTISHLGKAEGLDNQRIFSVCQSSSGAIWWSSLKGVGRFNGSKVRTYRLDDKVPFNHLGGRVIHVTAESKEVYAFDNRGSLFKFNVSLDRFELIAQISKKLGYEVALNDIQVTDRGIYLALHDGVYILTDNSFRQIVKGIYVNNIVAIKEASGILEQVEEIIKHKPDMFDLLSGDDSLTYQIIANGGVGVISVIGNALPKEFSRMVHLALDGDYEKARRLHHCFTDLYDLLFVDGNPAGVKALLHEMGYIENILRLPLVSTRLTTTERISLALQKLRISLSGR